MGFKRLFFDIETSYCLGWFWRPSYKTQITYAQIIKQAAIICISYKWQGQKQIHSLKWDNGDDKEMMKKFFKVMLEADEVVGHNSDNFDLKWIRTRFLLHGFKSCPQFKSIDTLKISRSQFNFPSNRLDDIGEYLGIGRKKKQGQKMEMWHDIILKNSKKAMADMIDYCDGDVVLLEKVYLTIEGFAKNKTHMGMLFNSKYDKCDCPQCASIKTVYVCTKVSAAGSFSIQLQCKDCGKYFAVSKQAYNKRQLEKLKKKNPLVA